MSKNCELKIDGCSIYIDQLDQLDTTRVHDAGNNRVIEWTSEQIRQSMIPLVSIMQSFQEAATELIVDEVELSLQVDVCLKGEVPVFKVISAESSAQMAVKFVWKNQKNGSSVN